MNIIFPMAGEAVRFGRKFKPFLLLGELTFIENAVFPFLEYRDKINKFYFIVTEEQQKTYNVNNELKKIFPDITINCIVIEKLTKGPYETVKQAIIKESITGPCIICDCDHRINIKPIIDDIEPNIDCLIPTWEIKLEEYHNWSKVQFNDENEITNICEKEFLDPKNGNIRGMLGCTYFKNSNFFEKYDLIYISELIKTLHKEKNYIKVTKIDSAEFFGDPKMKETCINNRRKRATIFCDVDGTLLKHSDSSSHQKIDDVIPITNNINIINELSKNNKIIITTARNKKFRNTLIKHLDKFNIKYDEIIMGCYAGPRYLINDRKTSHKFLKTAIAVELERNSNFERLKYQNEYEQEIIELLKGGSFSKTYLIKENNELFVRKWIKKDKKTHIHYNKLQRQYEDLKRYRFLSPTLFPSLLNSTDNDYEYYFDMKYYDGYESLDKCTKNKKVLVLSKMLTVLKSDIYCFSKEINGHKWLDSFLNNKIYPKFKDFSKKCDIMSGLIYNDDVKICGKTYIGLNKIINVILKNFIDDIIPTHIRNIHGDLNFENILVNNNNDIKLIDMDGANYYDAWELDIGKLFQSIVSKSEEWFNMTFDINDLINNEQHELEKYFDIDWFILNDYMKIFMNIYEDTYFNIQKKGIFYMCTYFIRFVPFMYLKSDNHAKFAIILAIVWLNKLISF